MRLLSLTLVGYRQFLDPVTLDLPEGITGICGPNGVGKSKLVEAIGYALYGPHSGILPKRDKASDIGSRAGQNVIPKVTLSLEIGRQRYELVRSSSSKHCVLRMDGDPNTIAETSSGVTNKMIELLHLTPDAFLGTFVARQREIASLQALNDKDRERLVNRLIGISLVEKAMQLAQAGRMDAKVAFEAAQTAAGERVEEVDSRLVTNRLNRQVAGEQEAKAQVAYKASQVEEVRANQHWEAMRKVAEQHAIKREQVQGAETLVATLGASVRDASTRVEQTGAAEIALALARTELLATEGVDDAVAAHEIRLSVATERDQQAGLQGTLTSVAESLAAMDVLLAEQATTESEIGKLQSAESSGAALLNIAEQAFRAAQTVERQITTRKRYVVETGPGGICDRCGQRLGNNLEQALQHLEAERAEAQGRIDQTELSIREQSKTHKSIQADLTRLISRKNALQERLKPYQKLLSERTRLETLIRASSERITRVNADAPDQPYDSERHNADRVRQQLRRAAEQAISKHSGVAAQAEEARQALSRHQTILKEKAVQLDSLRIQLSELPVDPEGLIEAEQAYREAHQNSKTLLRALSLAQSEIGRTQAQVDVTERELEQARRRWQGIRELRTRLLVSERTADLMRQLLVEISSEARPRITELMAGWAQALMGPHFQHVELTAEYRVRADNGSGLHEIEHFSGGEQTLLAIMLRVAISLYCQERAGYPAGVLILDEVFGDQDESHRMQLVQFLEEIRPNYHQILVVNHVTEVTEMLNSIITVTSIGERRSTAALRF